MTTKVSLRVLHGQLRNQDGGSAGNEWRVRKLPFVIGSAEDCHMRCQGATIRPHHCSLRAAAGRLLVVRMDESAELAVNDQPVTTERTLHSRDRLRVGGLEFELYLEQGEDPVERAPDQVSDLVSEMLAEADEEERAERLADPALRQFRVDVQQPAAAAEPAAEQPPSRPKKQPPKKLPPPAQFTAKDSVSAAEQVLKKMLDKRR